MSSPRTFVSFSDARSNLRAVLDAAQSGLVTTVTRDNSRFVIMSAERRRVELMSLRPADATVTAEGDGWSVILPGVPVHGEGDTFDEAVNDAVDALREYADDWNERLHRAPNHERHRAVVELVELSTDQELRDWLVAEPVARDDPPARASA